MGDRVTFDKNLDSSFFGISDADVTDPIPNFCTASCGSSCSAVSNPSCLSCVKDCIRDRIVDFMSGITDIMPVQDPLGLPTTGSQTATSMGFDCFDPDTTMGGFTTCSVRLGDVFHSTPIVVGSPSPLFFDIGFQTFAKTFRDRTGVVYVGANDGFLHGFNAGDLINASFANPVTNPFTGQTETVPFFSEGDGQELFAFAPPSFLPDAIAPLSKGPVSPSGITPPDYRFGDFKTFVVDNQFQRSFFDGSPLIADVWIDSDSSGANGILDNDSCSSTISSPDSVIDVCGKEWHTLLVAGYRNGGGAYTALDITNIDRTQSDLKKLADGPDYPKHLWTIFDEHVGNVWSDPTIGRVRMNTSDKNGVDRWVMFVGGGIDPLDTDPTNGVSFGNAFYAIDIVTGQVIFKFHPDGSLTNDDKMVCDMPSKVGAFDLNADGYIDLVYEGDTCGRLWRFDVSTPVETTSAVADTGPDGSAVLTAPDWTGDIAFCANTASECARTNNVPTVNLQPIFFAPTVVLDDIGRRHVIFITGNRREPSNTSEYGKLYNFIDEFIPAFLVGGTAISASMKTESDFSSPEEIIDLVPQTGVDNQFTTSDGTDVQGEYIVNFPDNVGTPSGEKGFGAPVVISGVLVFTTFTPSVESEENPCVGGTGFGRIFALDYLSGQPALLRIPGAQGLLEGQSDTQKTLAAGITVAQGMPTPAQLTFGARGSVVLTVAFTGSAATGGSQFLIWELPPFPSRTQTLFWEEIL
ncbi:MAG TPA: PilC/PilY family type IV pilus protein [Thermodesulfobacteriota bacterium]|nr:PilC/PilY family type IV pilus protein [Thermodesulfobacteriota bacterium]